VLFVDDDVVASGSSSSTWRHCAGRDTVVIGYDDAGRLHHAAWVSGAAIKLYDP
jgi:hypothetical protein